MRLGIFVTHPIQYFAPLWRELARAPGVELCVYFFSDHSLRGGLDPDFGVPVAWDVPLLEGYPSRFVRRDGDLGRPWSRASMGLPDAQSLIRRERLDAVLVHGYGNAFEVQVVAAARALGRRTLLRTELTDRRQPGGARGLRRQLRNLYVGWFLSQIDAFLYVGDLQRRYLRSIGIPDARLFASLYSVDTQLLEAQKAQAPRAQSRAHLGVPAGDTVLLFSGKLIARKDPLLLLAALARQPALERTWLALLGSGELQAEVERVGRPLLGPRLLLPGFVNQSELGPWFSAADVFVLPSRFETWGMVVNEAMQFGLPVVCSAEVGAAVDLVREGVTGWTFPAGDVEALESLLRRLIQDAALREQVGAAAREHVRRFSPAASARGIVEALYATLPPRDFTVKIH